MSERYGLTPAALYARVSSDRQDVDLSVAAQLRALRDYAEKNGYVVAREYIDEAESGRIADRPQFRRMLDEASLADSPFQEILVWKFSRFTRKREHAVAFKSMLRKRGIRVTSITEHADDSPTGKLMEAIIESVDEFYSENLAQEVLRGMREAASRGFWIGTYSPYGYRKVPVQDGAKKRPKLELDPPADGVVRRIFQMALLGTSILDITKTLNKEGIASPQGRRWTKTTIHRILTNESYTGTLVWGTRAKDNVPPVRVEDAFPAIVSRSDFERVSAILGSKAPAKIHPRRAASPYLLSGIVRCETCGKALTAHEAKSGQFTYYVCHSLLKQGQGACDTPRLNAKRFERMIIDAIRENILTESNIRDLVKLVNEELDSVIREQRERVEAIDEELNEIRRRLDRLWQAVETTDLEINDILPRIREHKERQEKLEMAADEARAILSVRMRGLGDEDAIAGYVKEMSEFLMESKLTETRAFIRSFVKEIGVVPGKATIRYTIPIFQSTTNASVLVGGELGRGRITDSRSIRRFVYLPTVVPPQWDTYCRPKASAFSLSQSPRSVLPVGEPSEVSNPATSSRVSTTSRRRRATSQGRAQPRDADVCGCWQSRPPPKPATQKAIERESLRPSASTTRLTCLEPASTAWAARSPAYMGWTG